MKKIYLMLTLVLAIMFTGCGPVLPRVPTNNNNIIIEVEKKNHITVCYQKSYHRKGVPQMKSILQETALYGLKNDYSYVAIVNSGVNNLSGFPINDWANMKKYLKLLDKEDYRIAFKFSEENGRVLVNDRIYLEVVYFKKSIPELFIWNLRKLRRDTK